VDRAANKDNERVKSILLEDGEIDATGKPLNGLMSKEGRRKDAEKQALAVKEPSG